MIKITKIAIDPSGDGYDAIYVDGKLLMAGDEYHDRISAKFEGYKEGLDFAKTKYVVEEFGFELKDEDDGDWDSYDYFAGKSLNVYLKKLRKFYKEI